MARNRKTHGISWPDPELLERAKMRAAELHVTLSQYINNLVRQDLDSRDLDWFEDAIEQLVGQKDPGPYALKRIFSHIRELNDFIDQLDREIESGRTANPDPDPTADLPRNLAGEGDQSPGDTSADSEKQA